MNAAANPYCRNGKCADYGTFNPKLSKTTPPKDLPSYAFEYYDGTKGTGVVYQDNVGIGGQSLGEMEFGLVTKSNTALGVIGLGYFQLSASTPRGAKLFPTFTKVLVTKGKINLEAFSIFLGHETASAGSILFGGVDTSKFSGGLATLPVQKDDGKYQQFFVRLESVSYAGKKSPPIDAILDTGISTTYLQMDIVSAIYQALNAEWDQQGYRYFSCDLKSSKKPIEFAFNGKIIRVPVGSFIGDPNAEKPFRGKSGKVLCEPALRIIGDKPGLRAVLGTNFLRSAYVVFDVTHNQISIAQAAYSKAGGGITEIPKTGVTALKIAETGNDDTENSEFTTATTGSSESESASFLNENQSNIGAEAGPSGYTTEEISTLPIKEEIGSDTELSTKDMTTNSQQGASNPNEPENELTTQQPAVLQAFRSDTPDVTNGEQETTEQQPETGFPPAGTADDFSEIDSQS